MGRHITGARIACALAATTIAGPAIAAPPALTPPSAPSRLHALLINGGGSPEDNFSSHLAHLRQMLALLAGAGVPPGQITVLNADGGDPAPDMVVREPEPEGFELLAGTPLGERLVPGVALGSSVLPGVHALPATRAAVDHWFAGARTRLRPGDTLLLYVTDHGTQNARDPLDNRIVLWGARDSLSVRQLRSLLDRLVPGVRVVALMSQCFSGGFAHLALGQGQPRPGKLPVASAPAPVCGYFSSTADRPAYGCYAEVAGRERVGHSFEFMEALARTGRFPMAHDEVLATDSTPDVPLKTSDLFLADLVGKGARALGVSPDRMIDNLLHEAWKTRARWEPELRLLDRIGHAYGLTSPRSLAEIEAVRPHLDELREQLQAQRKDWSALQQETGLTLQRRFFAGHRGWAARVTPGAIARLDAGGRARMAADLSAALRAELVSAAAGDEQLARRPDTIAARNAAADEAGYRMEVRLAVLLRLRTILTTVAGRVQLATLGSASHQAAYEALRRCEDLALPEVAGRAGLPPTAAAPAPAFPTVDEEQRGLKDVLPGWMGIVFGPLPPRRQQQLGLDEGAALVASVLPGSPAQAAGLALGDIVLGPPGHPFHEEREIRLWTMLLPVGRAQPLAVLRGARRLRLTLVPGVRPVDIRGLGRPEPAGPAPPVFGSTYRGSAEPTARGPFLLFFWATWCGPCKESLPEVLAFSRQRNIPVVAVTDEGSSDLDTFFARFRAPFPATVLSDENRVSFTAYAVSGTPTFVLVDGSLRVESYSVGYERRRGLSFPGWHWDGR
jgi:thiol-disulfide isomerase/thioredoxin